MRAPPEMEDDVMLSESLEHLIVKAEEIKREYVHEWETLAHTIICQNRKNIVKYQRARKDYECFKQLPSTYFTRNLLNQQILGQTYPTLEGNPANMPEILCDTKITFENNRIEQSETLILPKMEALPRGIMWTAVYHNHKIEDEPVLQYIPYFGDEDQEDVVSGVFQYQVNPAISDAEIKFDEAIMGRIIDALGNLIEEQPDYHQLVNAMSKRLQLYDNVVAKKISKLFHGDAENNSELLKSPSNASDRASRPNSAKSTSSSIADLAHLSDLEKVYIDEMDSYRSLYCRRCYIYDCNHHGVRKPVPLHIQKIKAIYARNCSLSEAPINESPCGDSCWISSPLSKMRVEWSEVHTMMIDKLYMVFAGNYCQMAKVYGKYPCNEVAIHCSLRGKDPLKLREEILSQAREIKLCRSKPKKRSNNYNIFLQRAANARQQMLESFSPCAHIGPCTIENCSCMKQNQFCSKHCFCISEDCKNFFKGCRCTKSRCRTKACPCYAAGRECDLDSCRTCKAHKNAEFPCENRNMADGKHKHLIIAKSSIPNAGWGAYSLDFVAKDDFVAEYRGELISQEEAERRGCLYDKVNLSYLFNLDSDNVVDAFRKGNKTRFMNHADSPNCYSRVVNVNGEHRIGLFANKDIPAHTELFYNYRYDKEIVHNELIKCRTIVDWMEDSQMAGKVSKKYCRRKN